MPFQKLFEWPGRILLKKKNNATLGDNRSRNKKKIFLKLSACNYWRIANYDQIVIDTRNNKTGIFKNTLGLFCVLQYCLPFKLRLPKKLLARGSWVLFYMFIFITDFDWNDAFSSGKMSFVAKYWQIVFIL